MLKKVINKLITGMHTYKVKIFIRKYEKNLQKRLKNDNFTILASNCAAGIMYNRLGKQFLSPTINMWFKQSDFIKFCTNLSYYVDCELEFIEPNEYGHPVAKLDDIYLYFNHAKTIKEAEENWNRRKTRINYDNLFILMYDREEYLKLNSVKCKNKIVFTDDKDFDLDFSYYIEPNPKAGMNKESYLDRDDYTLTTLEKEFDFVEWLNKCSHS